MGRKPLQMLAALGLAQSRKQEKDAETIHTQGIPGPEAWSGISSEPVFGAQVFPFIGRCLNSLSTFSFLLCQIESQCLSLGISVRIK